jgi:uncharacterized protein
MRVFSDPSSVSSIEMFLSRRTTTVMRPVSLLRTLLFIGSWIVCSASVCAQGSSATRDVSTTIADAPRRGPLVSFAKGGREHFLFGTLHVGRPDFVPMDWDVHAALLKSDVLVIELDTSTPDVRRQATKLFSADALARWAELSEGHREKLRALAIALGHAPSLAQRRQPWLVLVGAELSLYQFIGLSSAFGSERYLMGFAQATGKPVLALERLAENVAAWKDMPLSILENWIDMAKAEYDAKSSIPRLLELVKHWESGNLEGAWELFKPKAGESAFETYFREATLIRRNQAMVNNIINLSNAHTLFVAVGMLHLAGPDGLIARLQREGYEIKPGVRGVVATPDPVGPDIP